MGPHAFGGNKYPRYEEVGRIIYTKSRGLPGVGFESTKWKEDKDKTSGTVEQAVEDDTQPDGPTWSTILYEVPFAKDDREENYERCLRIGESCEE
jgi:hypothetical protein